MPSGLRLLLPLDFLHRVGDLAEGLAGLHVELTALGQIPQGHHAHHLAALQHGQAAHLPGRHEPGTGEINYRAVFACLEEIGYEGMIGFELIPQTTTAEAVKAIMRM